MRVAIYARSAAQYRGSNPTEGQVRLCRDEAATLGWLVSGIYVDEAISGSSSERPSLRHLLNDAATGQFDCVLLTSPDRISRDVGQYAEVRRALVSSNVSLATVRGAK